MTTVYFVRHGQSENNAKGLYNSPITPLSELGKKQAADIAERCAKLPIDVIVSSSTMRASQTATIVAQRIGKDLEKSDLFVERKIPTSLRDRRVDDPAVARYVDTTNKNFHVPEFRYEDGENFGDLKARALAGLDMLERRPEDHILVVSHGFFMWIVASAALFGKELTAEECVGIMRGLDLMENTGLTILRTSDLSPKIQYHDFIAKWQLWVWNDHAHLG